MTTPNRNDLIPAPHEKLRQWITPKISLMESGDTAGNKVAQIPAEDINRHGPS